jgi:serine/threonine protein kinase
MYEYFESGGMYAFAMELVEGPALTELIRGGPISVTDGVIWLSELLAALQALSEEGIVHRDMKPDNVLLHLNREVKLTDFGISRIPGAGYHEETDVRVGTVDYVAPEYLTTGRFDHRSDLYGAGLIFYEALTGKLPWTASDDLQHLAEVKSLPHGNDLLTKRPDLPEAFAAVVCRLLEPDPDSRFQKADHALLPLESLLAEVGAAASKGKRQVDSLLQYLNG